jgi:hypothetical protein
MPRGPIVVVGIVLYGLVSVSMPVSVALKPRLGEMADVVMMAGFLWPYPLFAILENVSPARGVAAWIVIGAVVLLGLGLVWWFTSYAQERLGRNKWSDWRAYVWAPWLWFLPLAALQAVVYALAFLIGLPVGE